MIGVGIIGLGTVGRGTYTILTDYNSLIRGRTGLDVRVVSVAEIDPEKCGSVVADGIDFVNDADALINDERVDIVVELVGGTDKAYRYITNALARNKWVVTANKALLAEKGEELFALAEKQGCEIGFEAAVCGGIPVIRAIREGLPGNRIGYLLGILNGTSNYILSKMEEEKLDFDEVLQEAQRLGFAEKDPTLDVEGVDAAHKLCILIRLAFHFPITMGEIVTRGISKIEPIDISFAREFGYRIKLLAIAKEEGGLVEARVEPAMIPMNHPMSNVNGVYNAVYLVGDKVGPNLYYGKGAGSDPTGSAVVSDVIDMAMRKITGCARASSPATRSGRRMKRGEESISPFYVRFKAQDMPGVLSKISGILARYDISISAVVQKGRKENDYVPIVMITYEASEENMRRAKEEIDGQSFVAGESLHMRIEEDNL
jgi:homoserine dehydrogenase